MNKCAGSRQNPLGDRVNGGIWGEATIANVKWGGARLRDLLLHAGITEDSVNEELQVVFLSHATPHEDEDTFASSLSLANALSKEREVLIAYEVRRSRRR
jgi:sulfite oxidase